MSFLARALPLLLLAFAAGCSHETADDDASASEANLDQGEVAPPKGPLAPDTTFGTNGTLNLEGASRALAAAKRADGSLAVLRVRESDVALSIVKVDGSAVTDVVLPDAPKLQYARALAQGDGTVVVGQIPTGTTPGDASVRFYVRRVGADGAIDPAFVPDPLDLRPAAATVDKDGKILIGGVFDGHAAVVRLNPNGALDPTFADGGAWIATDTRNAATSIAVAADGKIAIVTQSPEATALQRFSADGTPDATTIALPLNGGQTWNTALIATKTGLTYIGPNGDDPDSTYHLFTIDAAGAVTAGDAVTGEVVAAEDGSIVSASIAADACTLHVTADATAELTAAECKAGVSYVRLGRGKRAVVATTGDAVSVRMFGG